jgi:hypothetical protein
VIAVRVTVGYGARGTIDRWLRAWRKGGLAALRPSPRADTGTVRAHPELFAEAAALRLELPGRSAAQIASILYHRHGIAVAERTVRAQLRRAGLHRAALAATHPLGQPGGVQGVLRSVDRPVPGEPRAGLLAAEDPVPGVLAHELHLQDALQVRRGQPAQRLAEIDRAVTPEGQVLPSARRAPAPRRSWQYPLDNDRRPRLLR